MIAKPFSPGNAFPPKKSRRSGSASTRRYIGSCTNGSYDDLLQAASGAPRGEARSG